MLTVQQVPAVSSPSESLEFSQEVLSSQLVLINLADRKHSTATLPHPDAGSKVNLNPQRAPKALFLPKVLNEKDRDFL